MLKMTKIELEQISDIRIIDIIEKQRCGLCFVCSKRHVKANHTYVENYDMNKPEKLFDVLGRKYFSCVGYVTTLAI